MLKFTRRLLPLLAAASIAVVAGQTAEAQDTYTLRFNHVLGPSEPFHEGFMNAVSLVTFLLVFVPQIVLFVPNLLFNR
ncbi:hypothetical protein [Pseudorhizobium pelagicum]|uniref:Uncharacterized protein n=1 Tax=Pseudorhizobium pelagicum TaxID=1509405 RepID=A0A922NZK9_9HYPH|nr:hypothetical protein [Pseudorhizobium pelagicum]KEQ02424.1 hypothetical protein GV67_19580 [Pseudorhizobium pelagicum]KEQ07227.1 hypothetical protein GV68_04760 [Pseudorhizobium pelagicum]